MVGGSGSDIYDGYVGIAIEQVGDANDWIEIRYGFGGTVFGFYKDDSYADTLDRIEFTTEALAVLGDNDQRTELRQHTTELTGLSGATATASSLIPANCMLIGLTSYVTTTIEGECEDDGTGFACASDSDCDACSGGTNDGTPCEDDSPCTGGGTCSGSLKVCSGDGSTNCLVDGDCTPSPGGTCVAATCTASIDIGISGDADLFANDSALTSGTTTDMTDLTDTSFAPYITSATDVVLTPDSPDFSAGAIRLTIHCSQIVAEGS
jgi:hypothetical protein